MSFFGLPKQVQWAAWIGLGFAVWVVADLAHWWSIVPDYSFGYIVPLFVAYVLYDRWPKIAKAFELAPAGKGGDAGAAASPAPAGRVPAPLWIEWLTMPALAVGVIAFLFGALYKASEGYTLSGSFLMTLSFSGLFLVGAFHFCDATASGRRFTLHERIALAGLFLFPALVWIISAPLMSFAETAIATFLLNKVTSVVFWVFNLFGFVIERHGSVLRLPRGEVGVAEACSGIRSLTACLFAGSFLAAVFLDKLWKKVALVSMALVMAFATNLLRSLFLTSWAYAYGAEAIEGTVHDVTGYSVLGLTVVLLLCMIPLFNLKLELPEEDKESQPAAEPPSEVPSNR